MTIPAELSQVARTLTYNGSGTTAEVGIGTTVNIAGGLEIKGIQVISPAGIWQGSAAGIQGTQGTQGITGTQGTQGVQGIQGSQGIQGTQGIQGILGTQGIQGSQGIQGTQGIQGATGSQGTTGSTGAQGTTGTTGTQGTQGITGPTGGTSGQVLYNSGGTATSSSNLTFDGTTFRYNNGYGSAAPVYGCRAWANFSSITGSISTRGSANVSSISRLGLGSYQMNFSNSMPDANYTVVGACTSRVGIAVCAVITTFRRDIDVRVANSTSSTTFSTCHTQNSTALDNEDINVAVFR